MKLTAHLAEKMRWIHRYAEVESMRAQSIIKDTRCTLSYRRRRLSEVLWNASLKKQNAWINAVKVINSWNAEIYQDTLCFYSKIRMNIQTWHAICDTLTHDERRRWLLNPMNIMSLKTTIQII